MSHHKDGQLRISFKDLSEEFNTTSEVSLPNINAIHLHKKLFQTILALHPRDETAILVYKQQKMAPNVLHNNSVKFPKDILLHCSVHQHGRFDIRCKASILHRNVEIALAIGQLRNGLIAMGQTSACSQLKRTVIGCSPVKRNKGEERASPMHAHFHR